VEEVEGGKKRKKKLKVEVEGGRRIIFAVIR